MSEPAAEADLARPVGGRLGLVLLAAAALGGLAQGLASILWNDFAIPGGPPPTEAVLDATLREAPPVTQPAPKAAAAPAEAATDQNKAAEAAPPVIEAPQNAADAENAADTPAPGAFPYASPPPAPLLQIAPQSPAPPASAPMPAPPASMPAPPASAPEPAPTPAEAPT